METMTFVSKVKARNVGIKVEKKIIRMIYKTLLASVPHICGVEISLFKAVSSSKTKS
jgi:hypothetical protein